MKLWLGIYKYTIADKKERCHDTTFTYRTKKDLIKHLPDPKEWYLVRVEV